jgi:branched-chain amino acid transport system permease protein
MSVGMHLVVSGFSLGSFYALVALGFALIFGVTHAFNLAHGELIILSGYLAYFLWRGLEVHPLATLPLTVALMPVFALALAQLLKLVREPFPMNSLVVTFGVALVVEQALLSAFSADYRLIQPAAPALIQVPALGLALTETQVTLLVLSLLATGIVHLWLTRTFSGKALRATIQNREAARLVGINLGRMRTSAFAVGGLLIGLAGPLYGQTLYLYPAGGLEATLIAVTLTIFAGVGRIPTLLLGGWLLGLAESWAALALGANWRELVSALLLVLLLILRPEGLKIRTEG